MQVKSFPLSKGQYFEEVVKKKTIYIHHTVSSHNAENVISGWNNNLERVATAYVIGGLSIKKDNTEKFDGVIYKCFPEEKWAHHLGTKLNNNAALNKEAIAIEICNYGPAIKTKDGKFNTIYGQPLPADMVIELAAPFKTFKFFHKYTATQLAALKELLIDLSSRFTIDLKKGLQPLLNQNQGSAAFLINADAQAGKPGLWTHTNVRNDKSDCSPQPDLMTMIKSL